MVRNQLPGFAASASQCDDLASVGYVRFPSRSVRTPTMQKETPTMCTASRSFDGSSLPSTIHSEHQSASTSFRPESYTQPYLKFMTENPTVFHAVDAFVTQLASAGFEYLSERDLWTERIEPGGKYFTTRNGSALIAFSIGGQYKPGNGIAIVAGHVDALTAKLKPIPKLQSTAGYVQLGVAPYGGALNNTWWDRDLGIGGRVLVRDSKTGKIDTRLVKLDWPIARVPTLAPHFGAAAHGPFNKETQMVPIVGLDNSDQTNNDQLPLDNPKIKPGTFVATQPERLVQAIAHEMSIEDYSSIVNWELELYDIQPAQLGGLDKEFIFAGRIDDKLCSYAAVEALLASSEKDSCPESIKMVGCFDDEEIGSLLRQGARSNFMGSVIDRICEGIVHHERASTTTAAFTTKKSRDTNPSSGPNLQSQTLSNSFLISSDVIHAVNPNFLSAYLANHSPRLNTGVAISADPNGHMTTDSESTAFLHRVADKCGSVLQVFQIRNDSRSGGTIGPMTSSRLGLRAVDAGVPQLSMHSIRATTGSLDPGLGVKLFLGFFDFFEEVDEEFR